MTTMTVTTKITRRYLMNKTKHELCLFIDMLIDDIEEARAEIDALKQALVAMSEGCFGALPIETQIMVARIVEHGKVSEVKNDHM